MKPVEFMTEAERRSDEPGTKLALNTGIEEIARLESRLATSEKDRDKAVAWAEELRSFAEEMEAYELVDGAEISVPWDEHESPSERATRILSLPLPDSIKKMKEKIRREAFREAIEISDRYHYDEDHSKTCMSVRGWGDGPCNCGAGPNRISKALRAACEKGEEG